MASTRAPHEQAVKAVIHCDVDCFYCQVEVIDNPALAGRPLAVHQGNSGGFVAVNYQARAAGIRCGDGSDPTNLAARTFRFEGNRSLQQAQQVCPGLVTRPMRSDRYRQVSAQILALISQYATNGQCEKTSYDDFYVEVMQGASAAACVAWEPPADSELRILGGGSFHMLPFVLQLGAQVASQIKEAVRRQLGLTMSFGVAMGKLAARLAGPLNKPSGMTVVPPQQAPALLLGTPIVNIPQLRGQVGKQVVEQLSVEYVRDLAALQAKELTDLFGAATGQLLFDLGHCIDDKRVQAKGPQQSICCTKSYHGLRDFARVDEALQRLVFALWPRLLEERSISGRIPVKLKFSCKQGGREQQVRSYPLPFPQAATKQLQATTLGSVDPSAAQSSAVHTLIPNLAPRSRLQQAGTGGQILSTAPAAAAGSFGSIEPGLHALLGADEPDGLNFGIFSDDAVDPVDSHTHAIDASGSHGHTVDASGKHGLAADASDSHGHAQCWLEQGPHQAARHSIFQACMGLLKPKLLQPVLMNYMSVAGEYPKDPKQLHSQQGGMMRFLQPASAGSNQAEPGNDVCDSTNSQAHRTNEHLTVKAVNRLGNEMSSDQHAVGLPQPGRQQLQKRAVSSVSQARPSAVASVTTKKPRPSGPLDRFFNSKKS